jgi:hypothetical protein
MARPREIKEPRLPAEASFLPALRLRQFLHLNIAAA